MAADGQLYKLPIRVLVSTHRTDYLLTNEAEPRDTAAAEQEMRIKHFSQRPLDD